MENSTRQWTVDRGIRVIEHPPLGVVLGASWMIDQPWEEVERMYRRGLLTTVEYHGIELAQAGEPFTLEIAEDYDYCNDNMGMGYVRGTTVSRISWGW
jgi:hypothetical protein